MKIRAAALAFLLTIALPSFASSYLRIGVGADSTGDTVVADRDCGATQPPALFGCGEGSDGLPLAARGDFGRGAFTEIAGGRELGRFFRAELGLEIRQNLELEAEANFSGVAPPQPVRAGLRSHAAILAIAADPAPPAWRFRPFVIAGAGVVRNEIDSVRYAFPAIAPDALTLTRGGSWTGLAWNAGAGIAIRMSGAIDLELSVRREDLGEVRTGDGTATIVRPRGTFELDIAGTQADLETTSVTLSVRYRLIR